jgi:hypothetical protein
MDSIRFTAMFDDRYGIDSMTHLPQIELAVRFYGGTREHQAMLIQRMPFLAEMPSARHLGVMQRICAAHGKPF